MKSKARKSKSKPLTPDQFLHSIGINEKKAALYDGPSYWSEIERNGGSVSDLIEVDGFGPEAGTLRFINEKIAQISLSAEYDWFLYRLRQLEAYREYFSQPRRIADLGGGTGVVSLWLASQFPNCELTVYDHSPKQLELGRKWARSLKLRNIEFVLASYQELATRPPLANNDYVLFWRALSLDFPAPKTYDTSKAIDPRWPENPLPPVSLQAAMKAIDKLLRPTGHAEIICSWTGWGFVNLFSAIRRAGLGVDWWQSGWRFIQMKDGSWQVGDRLMVKPKRPHLGAHSREDATAFIEALQFLNGPMQLGTEKQPTAIKRFRGGELLASATCKSSDGRRQLCLSVKNGRLQLVVIAGRGKPRCYQHSLCGLSQMVSLMNQTMAEWGEKPEYELSQRFREFLESGEK